MFRVLGFGVEVHPEHGRGHIILDIEPARIM